MKTLVLVGVSLVILAVVSGCSNSQGETSRVGTWDISAKDLHTDRNTSTVLARGDVRIAFDSSVVTADS